VVAAGVAFYAFFALFPALAAVVSVYGLIADPQTVEQQISAFLTVTPESVRSVVASELQRLASTPATALSWGFVSGLALALWGASRGVNALIEAMNIAYDEQEQRGMIRLAALTLVLTIGGVVLVVAAMFSVVAIPIVLDRIGLGALGRLAVDLLRWPLLLLTMLVALCTTYRMGPSRDPKPARWFSPGALVASVLWLIASMVFSIFVESFSAYPRTFGSLGAVAVLLMWLYVGAYVVLLGAELDAETERQRRLR
jgi:membrane protein